MLFESTIYSILPPSPPQIIYKSNIHRKLFIELLNYELHFQLLNSWQFTQKPNLHKKPNTNHNLYTISSSSAACGVPVNLYHNFNYPKVHINIFLLNCPYSQNRDYFLTQYSFRHKISFNTHASSTYYKRKVCKRWSQWMCHCRTFSCQPMSRFATLSSRSPSPRVFQKRLLVW